MLRLINLNISIPFIATFMIQSAYATPPPPVNSSFDAATRAMDRFEPFLGSWILNQSYVDFDGIRKVNHLFLQAEREGYIVYISVTYKDRLDQFYIIKCDSYSNAYRIFLSGLLTWEGALLMMW